MKSKAERQIVQFPGVFDIEAVRKSTTIGEFDDHFIAKIYGFKDKIDYYRQSGSKWWLSKIRVPVVAINARDDPFIEETSLPTTSDLIIPNEDTSLLAPVKLHYTEKGGHCGFLSSFFTRVPSHGWLAEELSVSLAHIDKELRGATEVDTIRSVY